MHLRKGCSEYTQAHTYNIVKHTTYLSMYAVKLDGEQVDQGNVVCIPFFFHIAHLTDSVIYMEHISV